MREMSIKHMADELERLEEKAGDEGWGGEFREELFDEMILWTQEQHKHPSLGSMFAHLITVARGWWNNGK